MYDKWDCGLFGSRKLCEDRLYRLLVEMIDADILTGRDYNIPVKNVYEKNYYSSDLYNQKWLHIHGPVDESSIKKFKESGIDYMKQVEKNKNLYFLSGKIKKFRIVKDGFERSIHLYLESVIITDSIK